MLPTRGPCSNPDEFYDRMSNLFDNKGCVADRAEVISEQVYGPIIRNKLIVSENILRQLESELIHMGWIVIYCRPSIETVVGVELIEKPHKSREHLQKVRDNLVQIICAYDRVMDNLKKNGGRVVHYVWDKSYIYE